MYVFGGNSRTNASIALNSGTNTTFKAGQYATVDASAGAVVLVQPRNYSTINGTFSFKYGVMSGERYPFYEKYFLGEDGLNWMYAAIAIASFMGLLVVIGILICIIKCCRSCCCKQKVTPVNNKDSVHNKSLTDQPLDKSR